MKKLITIALALCLIACLATASAATKLVIGASAVPHAVILEAAQPLLAVFAMPPHGIPFCIFLKNSNCPFPVLTALKAFTTLPCRIRSAWVAT